MVALRQGCRPGVQRRDGRYNHARPPARAVAGGQQHLCSQRRADRRRAERPSHSRARADRVCCNLAPMPQEMPCLVRIQLLLLPLVLGVAAVPVVHVVAPAPAAPSAPSWPSGGAAPVQVVTLHEALCPDCVAQDWVLYGAKKDLASILNMTTLWWGNAKLRPGAEEIICQHGPVECEANQFLNCLQAYHPNLHDEFVHCFDWSLIFGCPGGCPGIVTRLCESERERNGTYAVVFVCAHACVSVRMQRMFVPVCIYGCKRRTDMYFRFVPMCMCPFVCLHQRTHVHMYKRTYTCMYASAPPPLPLYNKIMQNCSSSLGLDYSAMQKCATNDAGVDLVMRARAATAPYKHTYVPWLVINGV